jgi:hypothetical protein
VEAEVVWVVLAVWAADAVALAERCNLRPVSPKIAPDFQHLIFSCKLILT